MIVSQVIDTERLAQILSDLTSGHGHGPLRRFTEQEVSDALDASAAPQSVQTSPQAEETASAPPYHVPGPYEIALAAGTALIGTGTFQTPGAAMYAGWAAVPEFYRGRDWYVKELAPMLYQLQGGAQGEHEDAGGGPTNPN